jgi:trimeric autotransporter adhesin
MTEAPKNLLMFSIDDLNAFATLKSLYAGVVNTPNMDRLMGMGTTFTSAYCQTPLCNPSRTSVLTGQLPTTTQVFDNSTPWHEAVDPNDTIFKIVKDAGYHTVGAGKLLHTMTPALAEILYDSHFLPKYNVAFQATMPYAPVAPFTGNPDLLGDVQASKVISEFLTSYDSSQPFFASLGLYKPHAPWVVPQEYFDLYPLDQIQLPYHLNTDASDIPDFAKAWMDQALQNNIVDHGLWPQALQGYFAAMSYTDAQIGRVLDALEASGHLNDTVIALWSDHGYHLGDKDAWHKFTLWDEAGRAPLIIANPGNSSGQVVSTTVSLLDLMPTLLDVLGIAKPASLEGRSLVPLIENPMLDWDDAALTFIYDSWSLRTDEFRYIHYADGSEELYDMVGDPHQWTNLVHDPAYLEIKLALLDQAVGRLGEHGWIQGTDSSADVLNGNEADNYLVSPSQDAVLRGGMGDDWYFIWNINQSVEEAAGGGNDTILVAGDYSMPLNVEVMKPYGVKETQAFVLHGNVQNNTIIGIGGRETIFGLDGNDILTGGLGDDVLWGGDGDDYLAGEDDLDELYGGLGNDTLIGEDADVMLGGLGDDIFLVSDGLAVATENADEGADTVVSSVRSYVLPSNIENLTLLAPALNGTGNGLDNILVGSDGFNVLNGGDGNDSLDGRGGADKLIGESGNDLYYVDNSLDQVIEEVNGGTDTVYSSVNYALKPGTEVERLFALGNSALNLTGNEFNNEIRGGAGDDTIGGGAGNDLLDGGAGADKLTGGAGNDTYVVNNDGDVVVEGVGNGTDTVESSITTTLTNNVENLTLTGAASINGTGNVLGNTITGNSGNNRLDGMGGADAMAGGLGDDTYVVNIAGDTVTEGASAGADTVESSISFSLGANVENLTLAGTAAVDGTGNELGNAIVGNSNKNLIDGGAGADAMSGGAGNDTYVVDNVNDAAIEGAGAGFDTVISSVDHSLGINLENLTLTGGGNINGTGNVLNNTIIGNTGGNRLDGLGGADAMTGGVGDDTYIVNNIGDIVNEAASAGTDTVESSISYALGTNVENLTLIGTAAIDGTGNAVGNIIVGNTNKNRIDGGGGADNMSGGAGNDTYVVDNAGDVVTENASEGIDLVQSSVGTTLTTNVENLTLIGGADINGTGNVSANTITGNTGNNTLNGLGGADAMLGGDGNDTYVVNNAGDTVTELSGGASGIDLVQSSATYALSANVENLTLTGAGNINASGNAVANVLTGNTGNNILNGMGGADRMIGGAGADTYVVDNVSDTVTEGVGAGTDIVQSSVTHTLSANVENLTLTASGNIDGIGNGDANVLTGNTGNNRLDGQGGADIMSGDAGDDTYVVDNAGDTVTDLSGTDTVESSITHALGADIENLSLIGTDNINGFGNSGANVITGNTGNNRIDGAGGDDTMAGGLGDDTYVVSEAGDSVSEAFDAGADEVESAINHTLTANVENLRLTGSSDLTGTGNELGNTIIGNAGHNAIDGGAGADAMFGGLGDDTFVVDDVGDTVTENLGEGTDAVEASISYSLDGDVENLTLIGSADIDGTGNELGNTITGNSGHNAIDGKTGADAMVGGDGDDLYVVDDAGDTVAENSGEGADIVEASVNHTLSANVEDLLLTGSGDINGTGNSGANVLTGNAGNNRLDGQGGVDTMSGDAGDDTYVVDNAGDAVTDLSGTDTVESSITYTLDTDIENLSLIGTDNINGTGNGDANIITGNSGNNRIDGAGGVDTMAGGLGDDTYVVTEAGDSVMEGSGAGTDTVESSISFTLTVNVENLTLAGTTDIDGTGNGGANTITGSSGNNRINGADDVDSMAGGLGDDTYVVSQDGDSVFEALDAGTDTVESSIDYALTANVENLILSGSADIDGAGNELNNVISGNSGHNVLGGGAGDDLLDGGSGADAMTGGAGDDTYVVDDGDDNVTEYAIEGTDLVRSSMTYTLSADVENLTLTGGANIDGTGNSSANVITGNAGDNRIEGGGEADIMSGGDGNDTYVVDLTGDTVVEATGGGTDLVQASADHTLSADVENLELFGAALTGTGNSLSNAITGNAGNNTIDGAGGIDVMAGGLGDDTYLVDLTGDMVTEASGEGTDLVQASADYTLSADVENLELLGSALTGTGNSLNNVITGNAGGNTIDGAGGADTMIGGLGDDTYVVNDAGDTATEAIGAGTDMVNSSVSYTLGSNVENLALTGTAIQGTGNELNNVVTGNAEGNNLGGGEGNDTLNGNAGADSLTGGTGDDVLNGGSEDDVLLGGGSNDTLDGGTGADSMFGGTGNDIFYVDNTGDVISEFSGQGTDTVYAVINYTLSSNVEILVLGSDRMGTGNTLGNSITGSAGDNVIDGMAGNDTLTGGLGIDTFVFSTALNNSANVDSITDFSMADDSFNLKQSIFTTLSAGTLDADAFVTGTGAGDANDRIIYDNTMGVLFYDADGSGVGAQVKFANVTAGTALTNNDFVIS